MDFLLCMSILTIFRYKRLDFTMNITVSTSILLQDRIKMNTDKHDVNICHKI